MLELLWLLLTTILACVRPRHALVLESLLLRHQLAVLTRPTRTCRLIGRGFAVAQVYMAAWRQGRGAGDASGLRGAKYGRKGLSG